MRTPALAAGFLAAGVLTLGSAPQERTLPDYWKLVERCVDQGGVGSDFERVLEHMRSIEGERRMVGNRLACVLQGLAEPWSTPALAADLRAMLEAPATQRKGPRFQGCVAGVASWLDLQGEEAKGIEHAGLGELARLWSELEDPELTDLALLEGLSGYLELCHILIDEALGSVDSEVRTILYEGYAGFYEAWYRNHFPGATLAPEQEQALATFERLLVVPPTDRRLVLGVAEALLRLAEPDFLATLPRRLARVKEARPTEDFGEDVRAVVGQEARNRVLLTGRRGSLHSAPAALTIDLDGNDTYERAAVVDSPAMLASVVLDLGGDDSYRAAGPGPAFAAGGIALLVDREGKDRYESKRLGQAASALGFAALVDLAGDDVYLAEDYSQGHATCGVALLYDLAGDDSYHAWAFAQGGGIGYGLCALIDGGGNDRYLADEHWPDVYGDSGPDVYHGASQGYSTGIRSDVAGGIGVLLDLGDGADRYQSGSFAQGGGYYFSFGLLFDGGGDDQNFGSRYSQGFGVHQGIGVRWDLSGNDRYTCRSVAHTGMAWDEGVGFLIDEQGDDVYRTGALSCGGAAQTGVAVLLDLAGSDSYGTQGQSEGGTGGSDYHQKPSIGVLLDLGGGKDEYSAEGRADDTVRVTAGVEIFVDSKAKDARAALGSGKGR